MKDTFFEYDFSKLIFNDYVTPKEFLEMENEVLKDCFEDNNIYCPYMRKTSIYKTILKHCSNFDVDSYSNDELYTMCEYSNLCEYINSNCLGSKIEFIINQLEDCIDYFKDKSINTSKLDEIINIIINFISSLNKDDIEKYIQQINEMMENGKKS